MGDGDVAEGGRHSRHSKAGQAGHDRQGRHSRAGTAGQIGHVLSIVLNKGSLAGTIDPLSLKILHNRQNVLSAASH